MRLVAMTVAIGAALVVAACGSSSTAPPASSSAASSISSATTSQSGGAASVAVASSSLGQILVDGRGMSLYLFEADTSSKSTCSGNCTGTWPPLLTSGSPTAGNGAMQSLVGTTARGDGTTQVTYNGHPLYFFVSDQKPGDVKGEGLNSFGAGWDVLNPAGDKVEGGNS